MAESEKKIDHSKAITQEGRETEVLMTDRQYMEYKYFQGRFWGFLSIVFGTIAEIGRVFFSRLLFNKNERLNITEISNRGRRSDPVEEKKEKDKNESKTEESQTKDKASDKEERERGHNEKEQKDNITPESRDRITNLMFHENGVRKAFDHIGIGALPEQNAPNVYLFKALGEEQGNLQSTVYVMPKEDLILGKADALASALYAYGEGDKIDCALKSLITVGAVRYLCDQPLFDRGQTSGEPVTLSELTIKTSNGIEQMSLRGSKDFKNAVEVIVNREKTVLLTLDALKDQRYADYRDSLYTTVDQKMNPALTIGETNTLTISRSHEGMSVLYTEKEKVIDLGSYTFKTEADVRKLQEEMKEAKVDIRMHSEEGVLENLDITSASYVIGVVANPDMQPDKIDGQYLNTFTGEMEPGGASHLTLERTGNGVQVNLFYPSKDDPANSSMLFEYRNFSSLTGQDIHTMCKAVEKANEMAKSNDFITKDYTRNDLSDLMEGKGNAFHEPIIGIHPSEVREQFEAEKILNEIDEPEERQVQNEQEAWKTVGLDPYPIELAEEGHKEWDAFDAFQPDDPITCTDDPRMLNDPEYIRMQEEMCREMEENEHVYDELDYADR